MKTFNMNFNLSAWCQLEIEADSYEEAREKLFSMSFEEIAEITNCKNSDITDLDIEEEEDPDYEIYSGWEEDDEDEEV